MCRSDFFSKVVNSARIAGLFQHFRIFFGSTHEDLIMLFSNVSAMFSRLSLVHVLHNDVVTIYCLVSLTLSFVVFSSLMIPLVFMPTIYSSRVTCTDGQGTMHAHGLISWLPCTSYCYDTIYLCAESQAAVKFQFYPADTR